MAVSVGALGRLRPASMPLRLDKGRMATLVRQQPVSYVHSALCRYTETDAKEGGTAISLLS
jgi:hypothetical protein